MSKLLEANSLFLFTIPLLVDMKLSRELETDIEPPLDPNPLNTIFSPLSWPPSVTVLAHTNCASLIVYTEEKQ